MRTNLDSVSIDAFAAAWVHARGKPDAEPPAPSPPPALVDREPEEAPEETAHAAGDGATAWQELYGSEPMPWLLSYIADREAKLLPNSAEINAAIDSYPRTFAAWDDLAAIHDPCQHTYGRCLGIVGEGRVILRWLARK